MSHQTMDISSKLEDINFLKKTLEQHGVNEYDPSLIDEFLSISYAYATNIIKTAWEFSQYAEKAHLDCDDIQIAVKLQADKEKNVCNYKTIKEVATLVNAKPLPIIRPHNGWRLPSYRQWLSSTNYMRNTTKKRRKVPTPQEPRIIKRNMYRPNMQIPTMPMQFDVKPFLTSIDLT